MTELHLVCNRNGIKFRHSLHQYYFVGPIAIKMPAFLCNNTCKTHVPNIHLFTRAFLPVCINPSKRARRESERKRQRRQANRQTTDRQTDEHKSHHTWRYLNRMLFTHTFTSKDLGMAHMSKINATQTNQPCIQR